MEGGPTSLGGAELQRARWTAVPCDASAKQGALQRLLLVIGYWLWAEGKIGNLEKLKN